MYKFLIPVFIIIAVVTISTSCNKNFDTKCPNVEVSVPDSEKVSLNRYIDSAHITGVTYDLRGFYFSIKDTGIGTQPTPCNVIKVNYSGKLIDGTIFDSGHNIQLTLNQLIKGSQLSIPFLRNGGNIVLYLPPSLAYGNTASGSIPASSILIFRIELVGVQ